MSNIPDTEEFNGQLVYYKSSENMIEVSSNSIDVIITSPPYNRKKIYSSDEKESIPYDDDKDETIYHDFLKRVWKECYRVLSPDGLFFLNIGDAAGDQGKSEAAVNLAVDSGFKRLQTIVWIKSFLGKGHYTPSGGSRRLNNIWENIYILVKDKSRYRLDPKAVGIPYADKSNIGRYGKSDLRDAGNVWFIPYVRTTGSTFKKGHEAPFPIELPYKCIKLAGHSVNTILDPFGGTCSTLAAARLLGKKGIAYERHPRRDVIEERINHGKIVIQPTILLPHYELTTKYLTDTLNVLQKNPQEKLFSFTKKEQTTLTIVYDVLEQLGLDIPLLTEYISRINQEAENKEDSNKKGITDYFKGN